jgi:hypothetical protein
MDDPSSATVGCADSGAQTETIEYMQAWQCIGCGKLDGPQSCVGICQDHRVSLVYASEYEELRKQLEVARADLALLADQMRQIVNTTPKHQEWKRNYEALQELARRTLDQLTSCH